MDFSKIYNLYKFYKQISLQWPQFWFEVGWSLIATGILEEVVYKIVRCINYRPDVIGASRSFWRPRTGFILSRSKKNWCPVSKLRALFLGLSDFMLVLLHTGCSHQLKILKSWLIHWPYAKEVRGEGIDVEFHFIQNSELETKEVKIRKFLACLLGFSQNEHSLTLI